MSCLVLLEDSLCEIARSCDLGKEATASFSKGTLFKSRGPSALDADLFANAKKLTPQKYLARSPHPQQRAVFLQIHQPQATDTSVLQVKACIHVFLL